MTKKTIVNYQSESDEKILTSFLESDSIIQDNLTDIRKFTLTLLAGKYLEENGYVVEEDEIQKPTVGDFVSILDLSDTSSSLYVIPVIGQVMEETADAYLVNISVINHSHFHRKYVKNTQKSIPIDSVSKIEELEVGPMDLSDMLPSNKVIINSSQISTPPKKNSSTKKRNQMDDDGQEQTEQSSSKKKKTDESGIPRKKLTSQKSQSHVLKKLKLMARFDCWFVKDMSKKSRILMLMVQNMLQSSLE